jgi:hypothetical protein
MFSLCIIICLTSRHLKFHLKLCKLLDCLNTTFDNLLTLLQWMLRNVISEFWWGLIFIRSWISKNFKELRSFLNTKLTFFTNLAMSFIQILHGLVKWCDVWIIKSRSRLMGVSRGNSIILRMLLWWSLNLRGLNTFEGRHIFKNRLIRI